MVRWLANIIPIRHVPINSDPDSIRDAAELVSSLFNLPHIFVCEADQEILMLYVRQSVVMLKQRSG